jgi:Flp pilus assembly protein TadG
MGGVLLKRIRSSRGVSAVEFALVLPILLILLLGIVDYGWVFFVRLTMTNAAREGARTGVTGDAGSASADAVAAARAYLTTAGLSGVVTATTPSNADPRVAVTVTVDPFLPIVGFVPTPGSMQVVSTMRWEEAP